MKEVRGGAVHRRAGPPVARRLVEVGRLASVQLQRGIQGDTTAIPRDIGFLESGINKGTIPCVSL